MGDQITDWIGLIDSISIYPNNTVASYLIKMSLFFSRIDIVDDVCYSLNYHNKGRRSHLIRLPPNVEINLFYFLFPLKPF